MQCILILIKDRMQVETKIDKVTSAERSKDGFLEITSLEENGSIYYFPLQTVINCRVVSTNNSDKKASEDSSSNIIQLHSKAKQILNEAEADE